jgi:hypothetical protein
MEEKTEGCLSIEGPLEEPAGTGTAAKAVEGTEAGTRTVSTLLHNE